MGEPAAERQRRYRRHKAGDHSLCVPGRCDAVTPDVTEAVTDDGRNEPQEDRPQLGVAGAHLWREMTAEGDLPPMAMVLLLEACRIADRLELLDAQLRGEDSAWLRVVVDDDGEAALMVDKALAESRQQATALKGLMAELRQAAGSQSGKGKSGQSSKRTATQQDATTGVSGIADLTARIAERRTASSS